MSESKKSFWATIPGLVTGLAGLLTGIVGLVTVLIQLDVLGGDDSANVVAGGTTTTVVAGRSSSPAAGATTTAVSGRLTAQPSPIKLQPNERAKDVTVRNASTATVTVVDPEYSGPDAKAFSTDGGCTGVALRPGASCTLKVTLTPTGPLKTYRASLVLEAKEIPQVTEVPVEASTIL